MIGGGARFQVSGLGHQTPDPGVQVRVQDFPLSPPFSPQRSPLLSPPSSVIYHLSSVICHLPSIQPSFRVAGGGPGWRVAGFIHSVLYSVLNAALHSVLSGKLGPLPSIQSSSRFRWPVAAPGGGWLAFPFSPPRRPPRRPPWSTAATRSARGAAPYLEAVS
jgi:hypothetical protein